MMKKIILGVVFTLSMLVSTLGFAAEQTATLIVPGMSCPSCPYIIKSAISDIDGVKDVTVTIQRRTTTVVFDDAMTTVDTIMQATADVGFPSSVIEMTSGS